MNKIALFFFSLDFIKEHKKDFYINFLKNSIKIYKKYFDYFTILSYDSEKNRELLNIFNKSDIFFGNKNNFFNRVKDYINSKNIKKGYVFKFSLENYLFDFKIIDQYINSYDLIKFNKFPNFCSAIYNLELFSKYSCNDNTLIDIDSFFMKQLNRNSFLNLIPKKDDKYNFNYNFKIENLKKEDFKIFINYNGNIDKILENIESDNYLNYFTSIGIELTNYCNLACKICPHPNMKREKLFMKKEIFYKIIDDLEKLKTKNLKISLTQFGESLLHKDIFDFINYTYNKGFENIELISNGMLLTKNIAKKLIETKLKTLQISFDGITKKVYENIRINGNFDILMENILNFIKINKNIELVLQIISMKDTEKEVDKFVEFWKQKGVKTRVVYIHNWAGQVDNDIKKNRYIQSFCNNIFESIVIHSNGNIITCCRDIEGKMVLGNALKDNIIDIWFSDNLNCFREQQLNIDYNLYPLCKNCEVNKIFI